MRYATSRRSVLIVFWVIPDSNCDVLNDLFYLLVFSLIDVVIVSFFTIRCEKSSPMHGMWMKALFLFWRNRGKKESPHHALLAISPLD